MLYALKYIRHDTPFLTTFQKTYPDIFGSATFSFRIQKFPRPHVAHRCSDSLPITPDTCERKPYPERKSCGYKNILIPVDVVSSVAIFWDVTQRTPALRDISKNGCGGDYCRRGLSDALPCLGVLRLAVPCRTMQCFFTFWCSVFLCICLYALFWRLRAAKMKW